MTTTNTATANPITAYEFSQPCDTCERFGWEISELVSHSVSLGETENETFSFCGSCAKGEPTPVTNTQLHANILLIENALRQVATATEDKRFADYCDTLANIVKRSLAYQTASERNALETQGNA
jgi:hypothetical protein